MRRRLFLKHAAIAPAIGLALNSSAETGRQASSGQKTTVNLPSASERGRYHPGRIPNEYSLFLPGEREALKNSPRVLQIEPGLVKARVGSAEKNLKPGDAIEGWRLVTVLPWLNGTATAVFEKHVTHQGAIAYVTEAGEIANIPKRIGDLSEIRPRPTSSPHGVKFERPWPYVPGPDLLGDYILNSAEDPCYENVAALGPEMVGWTLVANEETAPEKSLWLEAGGKSRQCAESPQLTWAPDLKGRLFDPSRFLPSIYRAYMRYPDLYGYVPGYSKRTLLGGYLPAADIGVWNPTSQVGYEVMVILPVGVDARPIGRVRAMIPAKGARDIATSAGWLPVSGSEDFATPGNTGSPASPEGFVDRYWNGTAEDFFSALAGIWGYWQHFFEDKMKAEVPDEWLLDAARAGIVLSRCSYHGLEPTYQIGEGAYTKIPVSSHALFPVAHYLFVWAHELWNLTGEVDPYFQHYLDHYILPDGNFLYNTQDQVEATLDTGVFLENSARAYDYSHDIDALKKRLPALRRMMEFVLRRYRYTKEHFPPDDPRHGLIWGSPEADNGDPSDDYPESHAYFYQNASWTWRGLVEHARSLDRAGREHQDLELRKEAAEVAGVAREIRADIDRSLQKTLADRNPEMKEAGITPFTAFDTHRLPTDLGSYENHRYMMDWWTSDWGDPKLDAGHFRHRGLAGLQILGMNTNRDYPLTSNFMEHGTLAGRIRQDDYRPFLLTLYANLCYAMDTGNRYAPEDALLPGNYPGEGSPYAWSAVINSELLPTLGLRWLLCYEEHDQEVVHLQKAAPKHWFNPGESIRVTGCPTRFGHLCWHTESSGSQSQPRWRVTIEFAGPFAADLIVHLHPPGGGPLKKTSLGELRPHRVVLPAALLSGKGSVTLEIS